MSAAPHRKGNPHHKHVASKEMDELIETINNTDLGWKADTCKLQTHHEMRGKHCDKPI
jgi:hypothetical protein